MKLDFKKRTKHLLCGALGVIFCQMLYANANHSPATTDVQEAITQFQTAKQLHQAGKISQAQKILEVIVETVPEFHAARLKLVDIYQQQGKINTANHLLKTGLALDSEQPELIEKQKKMNVVTPKDHSIAGLANQYKKAIEYNNHGQIDKAKEMLQEVIDKAPAFHPARLALAKIYLKQEKGVEADVLLSKGLAIDENNVDFKHLRAEIAKVQGPKKSLDSAAMAKVEVNFREPVIEKKPIPPSKEEQAAYLFKKAQTQERQGHFNEAIQGYKNVLSKVPSYHPARLRLVELYKKNAMQGEAMALLHEGLKIDVNQPGYIIQIAHGYLKQNQPKSALEWLLKMPEQARNRSSYSSVLALAYLKKGHYDAARREYQKLTVLDSRNMRWWLGLAYANEKLGNVTIALKNYKKVKRIGQIESDALQYVDDRIQKLSKD